MNKPIDSADPLHNSLEKLDAMIKTTQDDVNETMKELAEAEETQDIETFLRNHKKPPKR